MAGGGEYPGGIGTFLNYGIWQLQSFSANPTKTSANTATFRELARAYASVMAGNQANQSPFGLTVQGGYNARPPGRA